MLNLKDLRLFLEKISLVFRKIFNFPKYFLIFDIGLKFLLKINLQIVLQRRANKNLSLFVLEGFLKEICHFVASLIPGWFLSSAG
jgi:hypothetical protein